MIPSLARQAYEKCSTQIENVRSPAPIRDEIDFENHFDYIHFNPTKHGYVPRPRDWPHSSFHRWVAYGHYDINWGAGYIPPQLPGNAGE